jgi:phage terminase Nu1 subunit (DNA packaging protein)
MGRVDLGRPMKQAAFGELVGVSQQAVSEFIKAAALGPGATCGEMLLAYCERLREMAAGRLGETGGLDLVQERAALARSQRIGHDQKNAERAGLFAPVGLLADVLAMGASAVGDRFDQLEGALKKSCPDLPEEAKTTIAQVIASARNEWIRSTEKLITARLDELADEADDGLDATSAEFDE